MGLTRWFEPIEATVRAARRGLHLIAALGALFAAAHAVPRWYIEAHQFRIDTHQGLGRPTPEGAHRDGVDFVAVILVGRHHVIGGETRVFDAHGLAGVRFTLADPWSMLLMDDARVIHETTPIQAGRCRRRPRYPGPHLPRRRDFRRRSRARVRRGLHYAVLPSPRESSP